MRGGSHSADSANSANSANSAGCKSKDILGYLLVCDILGYLLVCVCVCVLFLIVTMAGCRAEIEGEMGDHHIALQARSSIYLYIVTL